MNNLTFRVVIKNHKKYTLTLLLTLSHKYPLTNLQFDQNLRYLKNEKQNEELCPYYENLNLTISYNFFQIS